MKKVIFVLFLSTFVFACSNSSKTSQTSIGTPSNLSLADLQLQEAQQKISEEASTSVNAEFSIGKETFTASQDSALGKMECIRPVFVQSRLDKGKVEGVDFVVDDTLPTFSRFDEVQNKYITEHPIVDPVPNVETGHIAYEVYAAAHDTKCGSRNLVGKCSLYNHSHNARRNQFNLDKKNGLIAQGEEFPVDPKFIHSYWQNCITPNSNETDMYEQVFKSFILKASPGDEIDFSMWLQDGAGNSTFKSFRFQKITSMLE